MRSHPTAPRPRSEPGRQRPGAASVAVDPRWDPLRSREGFGEVLECVGVPGEGGVELEGMDG
jgi:hypothetical protein